LLGEADVEFQDEIATGLKGHEGRKRVVVQDGHSLSTEASCCLGVHDFVGGDFEKFAFESGEFKWSGR